jgi:hypothetical protein
MYSVGLPGGARVGIGALIFVEQESVVGAVFGGLDVGVPPAAFAALHGIGGAIDEN